MINELERRMFNPLMDFSLVYLFLCKSNDDEKNRNVVVGWKVFRGYKSLMGKV